MEGGRTVSARGEPWITTTNPPKTAPHIEVHLHYLHEVKARTISGSSRRSGFRRKRSKSAVDYLFPSISEAVATAEMMGCW